MIFETHNYLKNNMVKNYIDPLWKVVPISQKQLLDVKPSDLLHDGHFRKCNTYRSGGGYDRFPEIAFSRFGEKLHNWQFIVQLYGCVLNCPYCYVTHDGVWGDYYFYNTDTLTDFFNQSSCTVFHLMGGAPAIFMCQWPNLINNLKSKVQKAWLFHSDLLLCEYEYDFSILKSIAVDRALYAVNIKGVTKEEFFHNTGTKYDENLIWKNFLLIEKARLPYYITFTNVSKKGIKYFWNKYLKMFGDKRMKEQRKDSFLINIINYKALDNN